MTISLPAFLKATPASLQLVTAFYAAHRYQQQSIRVHRLKTSDYEKSMDPQSLAFLKGSLKPLGSEDTKRLLNLAEYLKLEQLKDVICLFLASQYFINYNVGLYFIRLTSLKMRTFFLYS